MTNRPALNMRRKVLLRARQSAALSGLPWDSPQPRLWDQPPPSVAGAGAGAYTTGALVGALGTLGEHKNATTAVERPGGMMVAVNASDHVEQALVANALRELGARQIEIADGTWQAGKWVDFDPVSEPKPFTGSHQLAET